MVNGSFLLLDLDRLIDFHSALGQGRSNVCYILWSKGEVKGVELMASGPDEAYNGYNFSFSDFAFGYCSRYLASIFWPWQLSAAPIQISSGPDPLSGGPRLLSVSHIPG